MPTARAFTMPKNQGDLVEALRVDLEAAGIAYVDEAGRYADFHSLRHTCGSLLAAAGVHPKVAQTIMRHSDINLTLSRYSHVFRGQDSEAVGKLPDFSQPSREAQTARATGPEGEKVFAICLANQGENQRISANFGGFLTGDRQKVKNCTKGPLEGQEPHSKPLAEAGFEPARSCEQGILSPQRLPVPPLGQPLVK